MGTTAEKIAKAVITQDRLGGIDFSPYRTATAIAGRAQVKKDLLGDLLAKGYDPAHAVLIYAQNFASIISEKMSLLKELASFVRIIDKAERAYMPDYPPISPVTDSYFTLWAFFDVQFGQSSETIGTCLQRIAQDIKLQDRLMAAIGVLQTSRMGFYVHCGLQGRFVLLREIGTGEIHRCHASSGYKGQSGQIWFARLVGPSAAEIDYHVVMTTPYVLVRTPEAMIEAYLVREISRIAGKRIPKDLDAHGFIMKHGPSVNHWNEYIICAYSNYQRDAIFLTGVPDIKDSLPHAL